MAAKVTPSTPGAPSFSLAIAYAWRNVSFLQTWTYKPQKRQDVSAFALTYSLRLRSCKLAMAVPDTLPVGQRRSVPGGVLCAQTRCRTRRVDGLTWGTYEADLERNLTDLHSRVYGKPQGKGRRR